MGRVGKMFWGIRLGLKHAPVMIQLIAPKPGACQMLRKPFDLSDLERIVDEMMGAPRRLPNLEIPDANLRAPRLFGTTSSWIAG